MSISFEKMCRTCMTEGTAMLSLFGPGSDSNAPMIPMENDFSSTSSITGMLSAFTTIKAKINDGLPTQVCLMCLSEINRAISFKQKCERSEYTLKMYLQQITTETDNAEKFVQDADENDDDDDVELKSNHNEICDESVDENDDDVELKSNHNETCDESVDENESSHNEICNESVEDRSEIAEFFKSNPTESEEEYHEIVEVESDYENDATEEQKTSCYENMRSDDNNDEEVLWYQCNSCLETFQQEVDFEKHICTTDKIHCTDCETEFTHQEMLDNHKCPFKEQSTIELSTIPIEETVEMVDNTPTAANTAQSIKFFCKKCGASFAFVRSLNIHQRSNKCTIKSFDCNICHRVFVRKKNYVLHMKTHAATKTPNSNDFNEMIISCKICTEILNNVDDLRQHMLDAHNECMPKHVCSHCLKGFNMLSTLKDHIRTHNGEKPFLCSTCGKGFSQSTNLKQHIRRHNRTKPYKCDVCEYSFVSKGELSAHLRKHTGDHPFVCEICKNGFTTSSSLVKHKRIHTGERPYACEYCPMRFLALGTLKNHHRTHTGEKPFACKLCKRSFSQRSDCVIHERSCTDKTLTKSSKSAFKNSSKTE